MESSPLTDMSLPYELKDTHMIARVLNLERTNCHSFFMEQAGRE